MVGDIYEGLTAVNRRIEQWEQLNCNVGLAKLWPRRAALEGQTAELPYILRNVWAFIAVASSHSVAIYRLSRKGLR